MIEVAVVVDLQGNALHWHLPPGRTGASIPDSPDLWQVIWENRHNILGIAHSHPGRGLPGPSRTDLTTFRAIEDALGRQLCWWIASETDLIVLHLKSRQVRLHYGSVNVLDEPSWLPELRRLSYGSNRPSGSTA